MKTQLTEHRIWKTYGRRQKDRCRQLGPHASYHLAHTPRRILFSLAHYKFTAKVIGERKRVLDLGCSDGLGLHILAETAREVVGVDFDREVMTWARRHTHKSNITYRCDNFLNKTYGTFDAVVSFDVIEHIMRKNEKTFFATVTNNLARDGMCVIGTPNITARKHSNKIVNDAHVNLYSAERLRRTMEHYFNNVFMFGANDEVIHTGFPPMTQYLLAVGCYKKG